MVVYLLTNTVNGMEYVGATSRSLPQRWNEHLYEARHDRSRNPLYRDMREHGFSVFDKRILSVALNRQALGELEAFWTRELETRSPQGYNRTDGGLGTPGREVYEHEKRDLAARSLGRIDTSETRAKRSASALGNKNAAGNKGKKKSPEHCAKLFAILNTPQAKANAKAARRRRTNAA